MNATEWFRGSLDTNSAIFLFYKYLIFLTFACDALQRFIYLIMSFKLASGSLKGSPVSKI